MKEKNVFKMGWVEYVLINYRWIFVLFFLLPASFIYDIYYFARSWIIFRTNSAPYQHERKVRHVQKQVQDWCNGSQDVPMCTARPGWQTISFRQPAYKKTFHKISIDLVDVLDVSTKDMTVKCEPLVTMGQLTHALINLGWTIPVVPEMDDLTVGGLVMGTGIETSSHTSGLFQHTCTAFEIVLADGSVVTCSKDNEPELFYSIPWSYGTLGFLTAVTIRIIPCKRFVKLTYDPCTTLEEFVSKFHAASSQKCDNQFVEGLLYSINSGVVMIGNMVDSCEPGKINAIGQWHKEWFFKHVESLLSGKSHEYMPLRDYYHRHTRSIFWEIQDIIPFGNHGIFRWLLGWMVPPKVSFLKLTQGETIKRLYENNHFIQDMLVPMNQLKNSIEYFHEEVMIYPVWICPFNLPAKPGMLQPVNCDNTLYVDIGTYGIPMRKFDPVLTTRRVEEFVRKVKGFQMLYADTYMTKSEFREMFDHSLYDKVRKDFNCIKAFPDVYDKVCRKARD